MPDRTGPPFRADHVGSPLRPPRLLEARARHAEGTIDAASLGAVEDEAIRDAVAMQRDVGLQTATDGEFRRTSWHMDFIYQLEGVNRAEGEIEVHFENEQGALDFTSAALVVDGPIRLEQPIFGEDFAFLKDLADTAGSAAKLTMHRPAWCTTAGAARPSIRRSTRMRNTSGRI